MIIMLVIAWRTSSLSICQSWELLEQLGPGLNWGRVGQTGTELHRLGGLLRAVSSVKQKGWFADDGVVAACGCG